MRKRTFSIVIAGAAATAALSVASVAELLRYSPYEDPGAGQAGFWLGLAALAVGGTMLTAIGLSLILRGARGYLRWKSSLTPGARVAADIAEIALMSEAHERWRGHNQAVSERLSRSVMGEDFEP